MAKRICVRCGKKFDLEEAQYRHDKEYDQDGFYDEQYPDGDMCAKCAIEETGTNISAGRNAFNPY